MALRYLSNTIRNKISFNKTASKIAKIQNSQLVNTVILPLLVSKRTLTHYPIDNDLYDLTSEQVQLRETVFDFCQKELAPIADQIDKDDDFPGFRDFMKKLGELGLLGVTADPNYGGSGMGIFEHCLVLEEMSRVSGGISMSCGAHSNLCINQINRKVLLGIYKSQNLKLREN